MKVLRADVLGMCMGVRRAESLARSAALEGARAGRTVFTYGPLIHNPQAVAELERAGVSVIDPEIFETGALDAKVKGSMVVIRAHGAPPWVFGHLAGIGAEIMDATCPRVLRSQKKARELMEAGFSVVIAGDRSHGEVTGILGHAPGAIVVETAEEAENLAKAWFGRQVALIAQTTIKRSEYQAIADALKAGIARFQEVDTVCPATAERQQALEELAGKVSAIVVVGGKNSANTQRLFMSAKASGKPSWHIETAEELSGEIFSYDTVGLTAGASTPDSMVDAVARYLSIYPSRPA